MSRYDFFEDRTTYVKEQLLEDNEGTVSGKDVHDAGYSLKFRMYQVTGTLLFNVDGTKVAISGGDYADTGDEKSGVEFYVKPTAEYGRVICRIVLIDGGTVDAATPSGKREYVWKEWAETVRESPQP